MADKKDLEYVYTQIDKIFRFTIGETGDFSGALYNGDFSMSLEQAQERKHEFIVENLNIREGSRVLDMGCGWGGFLKYIKHKGAEGIGVTLSTGQLKACRKNGLNVHLMDCRTIKPETFGTFDAIASLEAFEAFSSREDWEAGKQDEIYRNFFKSVHDLLPVGGRFYLQTATFSKNMIDYEDVDINADKDSIAYICAHMEKTFPGHWLPYSKEQIIKNTKPYFQLIFMNNGKLDTMETNRVWRKNFRKFNVRKYLFYLSLIPSYLFDKEFRRRIEIFGINSNELCYEREIMDHYRFVFEKV
jgi:cyclopropane-fatty-acyl-phospholipid synthase